jgi:hypothetical protein
VCVVAPAEQPRSREGQPDGEQPGEHEEAQPRGQYLREKTKADDGPRQAEIGGEEHAGQRFRPIVWACERGHRADGALEHQAAPDADDEHPGDEHGQAWLWQPYGDRQQPKSDQHRRHAARQERPGVPRPGEHLSDRGGRKHSERGCAGECARAVV